MGIKFLILALFSMHIAPISHTISSEGAQDGASDLFSPGRKHCPNDKESPGEGEDDATDCADSPRECEKWGIGAREGFRFTVEDFPEEFPLPSAPMKPAPKEKEVHVKTEELCKGAWRVHLLFPKPVEATVRKNCALMVTFNQLVDSKELIKISNHLGFLLKRVSNGVNTLYLVPKRAVFFQTSTQGHYFTVDVIPNYCAPIKETRPLKIAKARWLIEERCYKEALCALFRLKREYPCDKDILGLLAQLEGLIPRWQYQMHLYGLMQKKWPCDAGNLHEKF